MWYWDIGQHAWEAVKPISGILGAIIILHWLDIDVFDKLRDILQAAHGGHVRDLRKDNRELREELIKCTCGRGRRDP